MNTHLFWYPDMPHNDCEGQNVVSFWSNYILQFQWEYRFIQVPLIIFPIQNAGTVNISSPCSASVSLPALFLLCLDGVLSFLVEPVYDILCVNTTADSYFSQSATKYDSIWHFKGDSMGIG